MFMSAMVIASSGLRNILDPWDQVYAYVLVWVLAAAAYAIGLELWVRLGIKKLESLGMTGMLLIVFVVPLTMVYIVGKAMVPNLWWYGRNVSDAGAQLMLLLETVVFVGINCWVEIEKRRRG